MDGQIAEYPIPTPNSQRAAITSGPDGSVWFTEFGSSAIGQITSEGTVGEFPVPSAGSSPLGITAGPGGNLWFTESDPINGNKIGQLVLDGSAASSALGTELLAGPVRVLPVNAVDVLFASAQTEPLGPVIVKGTTGLLPPWPLTGKRAFHQLRSKASMSPSCFTSTSRIGPRRPRPLGPSAC